MCRETKVRFFVLVPPLFPIMFASILPLLILTAVSLPVFYLPGATGVLATVVAHLLVLALLAWCLRCLALRGKVYRTDEMLGGMRDFVGGDT